MFTFNPQAYGPVCQEFVQGMPLCELGPGRPNETLRRKLAALTPESLANGEKIRDRPMALCCLSGLWLLHNFLDESHTLSQDISTSSGSYWHGIMHRREPDFPNAKYWFRRVGPHPVFSELSQSAHELHRQFVAKHPSLEGDASFLATPSQWDAFQFIDLCEAAYRGNSNAAMLCRQVAQCEWQLLFDYCYRAALEK